MSFIYLLVLSIRPQIISAALWLCPLAQFRGSYQHKRRLRPRIRRMLWSTSGILGRIAVSLYVNRARVQLELYGDLVEMTASRVFWCSHRRRKFSQAVHCVWGLALRCWRYKNSPVCRRHLKTQFSHTFAVMEEPGRVLWHGIMLGLRFGNSGIMRLYLFIFCRSPVWPFDRHVIKREKWSQKIFQSSEAWRSQVW